MPNHVTNILEGSKEILDSLRLGENDIDFNTIIPMPDGLAGVTAWSDAESEAKRVIAHGGELKRDNVKSDDSFEAAKQMLANYKACGFTHWYPWSCENWGTKWNAYSTERREDNVLKFETAWSAPHDIITTLSKKHPEVEFVHKWADEDTGHNLGERKYLNGEFNENLHEDDPVRFALSITPEYADYYKEDPDTGKMVHKSDDEIDEMEAQQED